MARQTGPNMSLTSDGGGKPLPQVFSDVPSHEQIQGARRRIGQLAFWVLILLGMNVALIAAIFFIYSTSAGGRESVEEYSVLSLYQTVVEIARANFEGLGVGLTNLYFAAAYLAICHMLQALFFGLRLFSAKDDGFAAELSGTARALVVPGQLPVMFVLALITSLVLIFRSDPGRASVFQLAAAPFLWGVAAVVLASLVYAALSIIAGLLPQV